MNTEFKCFKLYESFINSLPEGTTQLRIYDVKDYEQGGCGMMMDNHPNSVTYLVITYTNIGTFYCYKIISKDDEMRKNKILGIIESLDAKKMNITKESEKFVIE